MNALVVILVTALVVGVLLYVLRILILNNFECFPVRSLDVGEFRVLLPKVCFEYFCSRQEPKNGRIAFRDRPFSNFSVVGGAQCNPARNERRGSGSES